MKGGAANGRRPARNLVAEIVEILEACGIGCDEYLLYDTIDIEAVEHLMASADGDVEVRFAVKGIPLSITPSGVDILISGQTVS